jgi:hypothetical protein
LSRTRRLVRSFEKSDDLGPQLGSRAVLVASEDHIDEVVEGPVLGINRRVCRLWRDGGTIRVSYDGAVRSVQPGFRRGQIEEDVAFGVERCMFASNWPVDRLYSDYGTVVDAYKEITAEWSEADRDAVFWKNAERFYRI